MTAFRPLVRPALPDDPEELTLTELEVGPWARTWAPPAEVSLIGVLVTAAALPVLTASPAAVGAVERR